MGDSPAASHYDETLVATSDSSGFGPVTLGETPKPPAQPAQQTTIPVSAAPGSGERQVLGQRYEILALLGAGGMGTVYRARDRELEEMVALKVLRRELVDAPGILDRFRREVKLARRVTHRNVARVFDIGEHEGEKFLTMELVDGEALSAVLARHGALPMPRALEIACAVAQGLSSAHAAGVVHRDLKPDNVLIAKDGRVVITDFGIARGAVEMGSSSALGMLLGTPAYMAPEQVEGRMDVDARADVYAFGALLFELFTGARAWPGESPFAVASASLVQPPPDPRSKRSGLPPAAVDLTTRCLARAPQDRPASMDAILGELLSLSSMVADATQPIPRSGIVATSPTPVPTEKTVAVLPFRNAGAPEDDYLAAELTDDLIDALSMTRRLKVRARGAVAKCCGMDRDPRDVGRELGVQVVVEGSVRRARGSVRISARLICVADGFQLWAKRFDRPEQEVLNINDEVARAIGEALAEGSRAAARGGPTDPIVIDLYIRGRHAYRQYWPEHIARAIELLEQARALSPDDPCIQSWLALALARRAFFDTESDFSPARRMAEDALASAPGLGEAQLALGVVLFHSGEPAAAVRVLRQAIANSPGLADAHAAVGRILVEAGLAEEGIRWLEMSLSLDADIANARQDIGRTLALLGRIDEAHAVLETLRERDDAFSYWTLRARVALWNNDPKSAEAFVGKLQDARSARMPQMMIEIAMGRLNRNDAVAHFEKLAQSASRRGRRRAFFLQLSAEFNGFLGNVEETLNALDDAVSAGLIDRLWMDRCPNLASVRAHPRYARIHADLVQRTDAIIAAYRA